MSRRARRLLIAAAAVVIVMTTLGLFVPYPGGSEASSGPGKVIQRTLPGSSEPPRKAADGRSGVRAQAGSFTYAIDVEDLSGLSLDTPPGASLQVWVMWRPPVVKHPRLQKLLDDVLLEEILPPLTANGPYVALFSVTKRQAIDLMYADQFGDLSVTRPVAE